ncbi:hypothetical protein [Nocardioides mesophilus]|uniref:DUF3592 domain-containing protein n=1 Tax=Nocardioides mesophilus TaxID=433659 RepID=A0A7G9RCW9_9ACTN|nr:hypothetical protein [Nocardioides mesophilus]QNN53444.1 hypothetical protein H9L09_03050 [Nocardioides mesophilus]
MIAAVAVGALFVAAGIALRPRRVGEELRTTGAVATSWRGYALGSPSWRYTVGFTDADGNAWTFEPHVVPAREQLPGAPVAVAYLPHDPAGTARRADGLDAALPGILILVGVTSAVVFSGLALLR